MKGPSLLRLLGKLILVDSIECLRCYHKQRHKKSPCNPEKNHVKPPRYIVLWMDKMTWFYSQGHLYSLIYLLMFTKSRVSCSLRQPGSLVWCPNSKPLGYPLRPTLTDGLAFGLLLLRLDVLHILCQYFFHLYVIEITVKAEYITDNSNQIWIIFAYRYENISHIKFEQELMEHLFTQSDLDGFGGGISSTRWGLRKDF